MNLVDSGLYYSGLTHIGGYIGLIWLVCCVLILIDVGLIWLYYSGNLRHMIRKMEPSELQFRKHSDPGVWCACLVPFCLLISRFMGNLLSDPVNLQMITLSATITLSSFTLWYRIKHQEHPKEKRKQLYNTEKIDLMLTLFLMLVDMFISGLGFGFLVTILGQVIYIKCLPLLFSSFQRSFTFGEGCIALQSVIIFIVYTITSLYEINHNATTVIGSFTIIAQVLLISEALLFISPVFPGLKWTNCPTYFYAASVTTLASITFPLITWMLHRNPLLWLLTYIINSKYVIFLVLWWTLLVIFALVIVFQKFNTSKRATTSERKFFHGLVVMVMTSGIRLDIEFTFLASLVVLGTFIYLEYIRSFDIRPISMLINEAFARFTDEKDQGSLILTNIYLLVGIFLPLWFTCDLKSANKLVLLSGVLSVGVGDSAASFIGSRYGRIKWPRSNNKTIEGTVSSIIAQLVVLEFFVLTNLLEYHNLLDLSVWFPILFTSLVEAYTTQVDNVVLPLIMYILFSITLQS